MTKMRSDILLIALTAALAAAVAFAQAPVPAIGPGSTVAAVALRADGAIIVAGTTQGSQGDQSSQGGLDAFIAWLTPEGLPERVLQFGTPGDERVGSLVLDDQGDIYVAGDTTTPLPFAIGDGMQFIVKFSPDGELQWARNLGGEQSYAPPVIALDRTGNLIVVGSQPSGRTKTYFRSGRQPLYEGYFSIFTENGDLTAHHVFSVDETQVPTHVLPMVDDDTFVVLGRESSEAFGGDQSELTQGFAARLDSDGSILDQNSITYPGDGTFPLFAALLERGNIAITTGTGMGVGEPEDEPAGVSYYAAIGVLGRNFEPVWLKSFGQARGYVGTAIAVTPMGSLVLGGYGNGDIGGEPQGLSDAFLAAYTMDGTRLWLTQYGTPLFDRSIGVAIMLDGTIITVGSWMGDWKNIIYGLGYVLGLGESWFVAAYTPDGERLSMRTYAATEVD